ncbi:MAG: alkyl hydroperoxide reductase AhpD [Hyphobacterium sp.]|nr:MAG: alkyl hydroperoxide reductase AhpD [Hyphobacterium sp.]
MPRYPSLNNDDYLEALFKRFPRGVKPLLELHDALMRDASDLDVATRELIAAYVSGLNACQFCYGAHKAMAQAFGVDPELIETLVVSGPADALVDRRLVPLLDYVRQITIEPSKSTDAMAEAVYAAGWSEDALYDAVATAALYAYMNRILDGAGISPKPLFTAPTDDELQARREGDYVGWGQKAGLID